MAAFGGRTQAVYSKPRGGFQAFSPGRAQSIQQPNSGTRYTAYSQQPVTRSKPPQQSVSYSQSFYSQPQEPAPAPQMAYQQPQAPQQRMPEPGFKSTVYGMDGTPMSPDQFYQQRDALIQLLNDDNARYQMQSGVGPGPGSGFQAPDFGAMWSQAGNMVQQGWKNPFASMFG